MRRIWLGVLVACGLLTSLFGVGSAQTSSPTDIVGVQWQLASIQTASGEEHLPTLPLSYTLELMPTGVAQVRIDCNLAVGSYQIGEGTLTFGPFRSEEQACMTNSIGDVYLTTLSASNSFSRTGNFLVIGTTNGDIMQFTVSIGGESWQWQYTEPRRGDKVTPPDPTIYVIEFHPAGIVTVKTACGEGAGTFAQMGSTLSIQGIEMASTPCPEGTLDGDFVNALTSSSQVSLADVELVIELANGDKMFFVAAPKTEESTPVASPESTPAV